MRPGPSGSRPYSVPVQLGDVANEGALPFGKPLDGVRVLAAEQMQALPFATQLLGRLGADVVKVEHPEHGESGRASTPAMIDPQGRKVGATYLRNNFGKRSLGIDLKSLEGRELFLPLRSVSEDGSEACGGEHVLCVLGISAADGKR